VAPVRELVRRWRTRLRQRFGLGPRHRVVYDANRTSRTDGPYALIDYLPQAFLVPQDGPAFLHHANLRRCRILAEALGERGFVVDVCNPRDRSFRPRRAYDLVLGERLDWGRIDSRFPPDALRVFLATTMEHRAHNANVRRRHERLLGRGRPPVPVRRLYLERMPAVERAHAVVGVGDEVTLGTWRAVCPGPAFAFDGFALRAGVEADERRDFETARRRFLFFASGTQVQKGLDLLLEIFARRPQLHLHVCSRFESEREFAAAYRHELLELPNVHAHGWIRVNSGLFRELLGSCAWIVHPSCSEGQAGAVVHALHSGLVPIVTRECGLAGAARPLADDALETLARAVDEAADRPAERCREEAEATRRHARSRFTEERFAARFRSILDELLALRPALARGKPA
jgi:glycosyltransferase involved in cell wall biosynthesis